jgi:hypothetical protein
MERVRRQGVSELDRILEISERTMQHCAFVASVKIHMDKLDDLQGLNRATREFHSSGSISGNTWDGWDRIAQRMTEDNHMEFDLGTPEVHERFWSVAEAYAEEVLIKTEDEAQQGTSTYVFAPCRVLKRREAARTIPTQCQGFITGEWSSQNDSRE